ncbi:MAG TPA: DUF4019 domain-containing protein [Blastocatellia bacterium]|nr:DUF4019 domain-containing protein [Blastocatellia bacterium]
MQANGVIDQAVLESVQQWLALIDAGDWRESLNQASPLFKSGFQTATYFRRGVSEQEWESSLAYMQTHLGAAVSRSLKSARSADEFPDEPEGKHLALEYESHFERSKNTVETVTLTVDPDGRWRVSGYRIVQRIQVLDSTESQQSTNEGI